MKLQFVKLPHGKDMPLPKYAHVGDAGMDICAAIDSPITLQPGERKLIPTGFSVIIPKNYEIQIRPRSGLAHKFGVQAFFGTIDYSYRGELGVLLFNFGDAPYTVNRFDKIAQLVLSFLPKPVIAESFELGTTSRGTGGFGSTGLSAAPINPVPVAAKQVETILENVAETVPETVVETVEPEPENISENEESEPETVPVTIDVPVVSEVVAEPELVEIEPPKSKKSKSSQ